MRNITEIKAFENHTGLSNEQMSNNRKSASNLHSIRNPVIFPFIAVVLPLADACGVVLELLSEVLDCGKYNDTNCIAGAEEEFSK